MADIPVYLIAGFLDGGKTDFINGILQDGFARMMISKTRGMRRFCTRAISKF